MRRARGDVHDTAAIPDLAFGLTLPDGSPHYFLVEIDRGTMPVIRSTVYHKKVLDF
jgi:hypothetical protein